jgi:hypothetical protein
MLHRFVVELLSEVVEVADRLLLNITVFTHHSTTVFLVIIDLGRLESLVGHLLLYLGGSLMLLSG